ncbi:MAG: ExeM/NucH family extracellular endonuclease, partial [Microbacterium sp.]|uniref:ExeM/NucH family extracellular endonuclease n=1 Tax=Microbacterium sp. TaxID=51671 RepID=UPI003BAE9547
MMLVPDDARKGVESSEHRKRGRAGALALTTAVALVIGPMGAAPALAAEEPVDAPAISATETPAPETPVPETPAPEDRAPGETAPEAKADEGVSQESAPVAPLAATAATHTIAEVQGTADVSPLTGQTVTVEGVVTADYRTGGYKGIVIQTQGSGGETDATPGASDGIFVFLNALAPTLAIGDLVSVTGSVSEYFGQTQLSPAALEGVEVVTAGAGVPATTPLPDTMLGADREQFENMYVAPAGTYRLASSHQLYNFGSLWLNAGADLNVKSTETTRPGADAAAIAAENRANRIFLDDGWSLQVTNKNHPGEQPYFTDDAAVRGGDTVEFGDNGYVLQWGFDDWRLQPVVPIDNTSPADLKVGFAPTNPRPVTAPEVGGDVQVASFNVYNYFTTLKSENTDARGAANAAQFATQKSKIVSAINGLDAEIVALMEIENSVKLGKPIDSALADLVAGLNQAAGSEVWAYVPTPAALGDAATTDYITNAIIYKKDAVVPKGESATVIDETVWGNAREPIAQAFDIDGRVVTVVANHFKSKSDPKDGTSEPADGQGFFNADRVEQAQSLLAFTDELTQASGSEDLLLIG